MMICCTHCGKVASAVAVPTPTGKLWALRSTVRQCCLSLECDVRAGMRGARWDAWFTLGSITVDCAPSGLMQAAAAAVEAAAAAIEAAAAATRGSVGAIW